MVKGNDELRDVIVGDGVSDLSLTGWEMLGIADIHVKSHDKMRDGLCLTNYQLLQSKLSGYPFFTLVWKFLGFQGASKVPELDDSLPFSIFVRVFRRNWCLRELPMCM